MNIELQQFVTKENLTRTPPEGCDLHVGQKVKWVNDYGIEWEHKIIGFIHGYKVGSMKREVFLDTDSYWYPLAVEDLEAIQ